jgi:hypothetical protein
MQFVKEPGIELDTWRKEHTQTVGGGGGELSQKVSQIPLAGRFCNYIRKLVQQFMCDILSQ